MIRRYRCGTEEKTDPKRKNNCGGGGDAHFIGYGNLWMDDIASRPNDAATLTAEVVLPTPPFWFANAIVLPIWNFLLV